MSDSLIDLLSSPPAPPMSVDEHAVYAAGRAMVRRRGWLRGGLAAATCVAVAGLGWGVLPRTGPTSDLRLGGAGATKGISCDTPGKSLGDSGTVTFGPASLSVQARIGTCEGIRVQTSYVIPGYAETGMVGTQPAPATGAVFLVVGMRNPLEWAKPPGTAVAILPPGQRICSLTHAGRPLDDLRGSMTPARTQTWGGGWTFVAQQLPADAVRWEWRLRTCGSDRNLAPVNVGPTVPTPGNPEFAARPPLAAIPLSGGDRLVVGRAESDPTAVSPDSQTVPVTLRSGDDRVLARDTVGPFRVPDLAADPTIGGYVSAFAPAGLPGHTLSFAVGTPDVPSFTLDTSCNPDLEVTTARTVVLPGSLTRLAVFDVRGPDGRPAPTSVDAYSTQCHNGPS